MSDLLEKINNYFKYLSEKYPDHVCSKRADHRTYSYNCRLETIKAPGVLSSLHNNPEGGPASICYYYAYGDAMFHYVKLGKYHRLDGPAKHGLRVDHCNNPIYENHWYVDGEFVSPAVLYAIKTKVGLTWSDLQNLDKNNQHHIDFQTLLLQHINRGKNLIIPA